jgi:hypothetical protein
MVNVRTDTVSLIHQKMINIERHKLLSWLKFGLGCCFPSRAKEGPLAGR